ncbi:MAG: 50S ribosomal protein L3 [Pseudomonadota bacterium]
MIEGLLGKKLGMSSRFSSEGRRLAVTVLQVGPCVVTQIKRGAKDGYDALQIGFEEKKPKKMSKPLAGHVKKAGAHGLRFFREFNAEDCASFSDGQKLCVDIFSVGDLVDVSGTTKGRGFAGVVKRWGFHGGKATHGSNSHRVPGSIGQCAWPSKVIKGKKMPGHYGNSRVTVKCLEIIDVLPEENLLMVKGAVPGACGSLVEVCMSKRPSGDREGKS